MNIILFTRDHGVADGALPVLLVSSAQQSRVTARTPGDALMMEGQILADWGGYIALEREGWGLTNRRIIVFYDPVRVSPLPGQFPSGTCLIAENDQNMTGEMLLRLIMAPDAEYLSVTKSVRWKKITDELTVREGTVAQLYLKGMTATQMARKLNRTETAIQVHLRRVREKLGLQGQSDYELMSALRGSELR